MSHKKRSKGPAITPTRPRSTVAVLKTSPKHVVEDYGKLMRMANYQDFIDPKYKTIIKLNLSWSLYYPACSTEPWQLEGILKTLREDGYDNIVAMENKTVVTNPMKGVKQNKWQPILDKYDVEFIPLMDVEWVPSKDIVKSDLPAMDHIFGGTHKIPKCFVGTNVIHPPTIKTHGHTTMTGAMKNAFGGLITQRRHHCHKMIHEVLVDLLKIQKEIHKGIFAVMDGTVCGNGAGPRTMEPVIENMILASEDQVAIDAISATLMGYEPKDITFIRLGQEEGLGFYDRGKIDVVGQDISDINFHFKTEESPVVWGDKLFRKGRLSFLEHVLFHTELFNLPIFLSAFYHDILWYPLVGKKKIRKFNGTEWGKLFSRYKEP